MNIGIPVGNKSFHSVQVPLPFLFVIRCFQHHGLQIRTGIGFGQVHRHGLPFGNPRQVFVFLLVRSKLVNCFATVLQHPDILETGIRPAHDIGRNHVGHHRKIQSPETSWESHSHQFGLVQGIQVLLGGRSVRYSSVGHCRSAMIYRFGIRFDDITADLANYFQNFVVAVHSVFKIHRSVIVSIFICVISFFEFHNSFHQWMVQIVSELRRVGIKVCHFFLF